jgi:hypothetical protein
MFMAACGIGFEVMSALNSSPWTAENFGADETKARSCREYTAISIGINLVLGTGTSLLVGSWWPLAGVMSISLFMWWIYNRAIARGQASGSSGWGGQQVAMAANYNGLAGFVRFS